MQNDDAWSGYFTKSSSNWMLGTQACATTTQRMDVKSFKKNLSAASVCERIFFDFNTLRQKFEPCPKGPMHPAVLLSPLQIDQCKSLVYTQVRSNLDLAWSQQGLACTGLPPKTQSKKLKVKHKVYSQTREIETDRMAVDIASWGSKPTPQDTWWQLLVQHFQRFAKLSCHPGVDQMFETFNTIWLVSGVVFNKRTHFIPSFKYAQTSLSRLSLRKQLHIGFVVFKESSEHLPGHWLRTGLQPVNANQMLGPGQVKNFWKMWAWCQEFHVKVSHTLTLLHSSEWCKCFKVYVRVPFAHLCHQQHC